jgi:outer membrane receptor protein involved in Fe transport
MNRLTLFFCCLLSLTSVRAQRPGSGDGSISGRVIDSLTQKPVEYATITVFALDNDKAGGDNGKPGGDNPGNGKPVNGATADAKGRFTVTGLVPGVYKITVDFIGYQPHTIPQVRVTGGEALLGKIVLSKQVQDLQTIVIKAPLVENRLDKMIYNAEKDVTAQGGVATDVLKKVPQVSVDVDGNVELQGNSDIRFLINGKPSSIFGNNITDALQSIPASQIKSIEVITSPGAKYDAEGTGGIINIILKENKVRGINGNLSMAAGTRLENGSFNLNARSGNFGANAYFSGNAQLPGTTLTGMDRVSQDTAAKTQTTLLQNGNTRFSRHGYETGIGFDWTPLPRSTFTASLGYDRFGNNGTGQTAQEQIVTGSGGSDVLSQLQLDNHFLGQSIDYSLSYKKTFRREDQELDILYDHSDGKSLSTYAQTQAPVPPVDSLASGSRGDNPGTDKETELQLDYVQPLWTGVKLEAGGKLQTRKIYSLSDVVTLNPGAPGYVYDSSQSNNLTYNRYVYAGYADVSFPIGKILDIKGGARFERTETNATFSSSGKAPIPGYNTVVPSFLVAHTFAHDQTLRFSFTKRIQRPGYRVLNPFVNAADPKNITVGNPYLQPEIAHNMELSYNRNFDKGASINIALFYRHNTQDIQPYIVYYPSYTVGDSTYQDVALSTYENIGSEKQYGLNIFGSVPLGTKINIRSNFALFDKYIQNTTLGGGTINAVNYRLNANLTYEISNTFILEAFGNFSSSRTEVQGKYPSFTTYTVAFRKQLWHKKGSIGFTTTNPFAKYVTQKTEVTGTGFVLDSFRDIPYRSFGISFTYKFGKLEFKKDKPDAAPGGGAQDE